MSLITRCPACGTLFKLVPDQLRISSGWVRCGKCHLVFDAKSHMLGDTEAVAVEVAAARQTLAARAAAKSAAEQNAAKPQTPEPVAPPPQQQPSPPSPPPPKAPPPPKPQPAPPAPVSAPPPPPKAPPPKPPAPVSAPSPLPSPPPSPPPPKPRQESAAMRAEIARWRDERSGQTAPSADPPVSDTTRVQLDDGIEVQEMELHFGDLREFQPLLNKKDAAPAQAPQETKEKGAPPPQETEDDKSDDDAAPAEEAPEEAAPSFVREARRRAFWQSAPVRALLWLLLLLGAAGLALQVALTRRDWLATAYPATEPALRQLCRVAGCTVGPYRQLDAMAVESSSFTRVTGNVYQFSVTLRNNAALPVAMPALDLTLSDMQGQPVLRRVIAPDELGAPATLAAGGEFAGTARLTLAPLPDSAAVISYRVEAFYP